METGFSTPARAQFQEFVTEDTEIEVPENKGPENEDGDADTVVEGGQTPTPPGSPVAVWCHSPCLSHINFTTSNLLSEYVW